MSQTNTNVVLSNCLDILTTEELLEFAIEVDWIRFFLGDGCWQIVKRELKELTNLSWRDALQVAVKSSLNGATIPAECLPQQS